jgi:hypothetical protein
MIYTLYEPSTGHITNNLHIVSTDDLANYLGDLAAISGEYNSDQYYIQDQTAVAKMPKPGPEYSYNYTDHTWEINTAYQIKYARITRNQALTEIDAVSPVRYANLTTDQQTELQQYRQLLLDVPQQLAFPTVIDWPSRPTWL